MKTKDLLFLKKGRIRGHQKLILATDAVAKLLLNDIEAGVSLFKRFDNFSPQDFKNYFDEMISTGKMRNDDTTILIIRF